MLTHESLPKRDRGDWVHQFIHRWPTLLGIGVATLTFFGEEVNVGFVSAVSSVVVLMAFIYLGTAVLERRQAAWVFFLAGFVLLAAGRLLNLGGALPAVFLVGALIFLVLGVARGQIRKGSALLLQIVGMLGFGAIGLLALSVNPELGGYLVAAALLGHAAWDAVHFWRNRVVTRSYAEFCGVLDLVLGVALIVMLALR
jgi:hypothetical protein